MIIRYLRQQRTRRINVMLHLPRDGMGGCFYPFMKFFSGFMAPLVVFSLFSNVLIGGNDILPDGIKLAVFLVGSILSFLSSFVAIDAFDTLFRRKRGTADVPMTVMQVMESYAAQMREQMKDGPAKDARLSIIGRIPAHAHDGLDKLSYEELAIVEDAVLYLFEGAGKNEGYAYGIKFMFIAFGVIFFALFGTIYQWILPHMRDYWGPNAANGLGSRLTA